MAWISIHQQIRDHRKTRNLFRTLGINRAEAIGTLTLIWTWAVDNCNQEGELLSVTKEDIADAAYWRKDPSVLYSALVDTGWIDDDKGKMYLHDWSDFNKPFYDYIARKEKDKQRKRNVLSAEIPQETPRKSAGKSVEMRGEFHNSPSPSPSPSQEPSQTLEIATVKKPRKTKPEIIKKVFGEKVHLSEAEYGKLIAHHGEADTRQMISILDNWYLTKGNKPNTSDYHTMVGVGWVLKRFNEDLRKQGGQAFKQNQPNRPKGFDAIDQWATMTEGMDENE